jgi:hypothetical protein
MELYETDEHYQIALNNGEIGSFVQNKSDDRVAGIVILELCKEIKRLQETEQAI